jgi:concentrative nucleoside transporter, CNT family
MADREHNSSPMPGVVRNNDPALDIKHEHEHEHVHHSAHAVHPDHIVYSTGTTDEKSNIPNPSAQDSHKHPIVADEKHVSHDVESGAYYEVEKGTRSSNDPDGELDTVQKPWYKSFKLAYRKFRLPVHIFFAALFTG